MEEQVFRLAKPKKKGILPLIFSRFFLIFLLLIVEVLIIVVGYIMLYDYSHQIVILFLFFDVAMVIYLFCSTIDPSAKLTWFFIMSTLPVVGAMLLAFTRNNIGNRKLTKRCRKLINDTMTAIPQPEGVMEELGADGEDTDDLVRYLNRSGCFPAFKNTSVKFFPIGEAKFAAMIEELKKAESFIFMEYFIIEEGYMWGEILKILIEKAKAGVDVRVMYDGMCEMSTLKPSYWKLLEKHGIKAKPFSPIIPLLSSHYNYRDHRKILVIDGKVAFNGGVNLADEYINRIERFGHWKDTAVMVKGEAVRSFTLMFLQMWNINEEKTQFEPFIEDTGYVPEDAAGYVIPYCDMPLDDDKVGETVYMDILNRAGHYVHFMTPYLILDGQLETALKYAAERGVDVKLILPGIPDKRIPYDLAKTHYKSLTRSGVQIYEYTPGFVHAKVCVSDDIKAIVGTINLDYRSLYHHFECATYLYKTPCISEIEADFEKTLAKCRRVTPESIRGESFKTKAVGSLVKFIAPLL